MSHQEAKQKSRLPGGAGAQGGLDQSPRERYEPERDPGAEAPSRRRCEPDLPPVGIHRPQAVPRPGLQRIAMLGNHLPRHCGIATFTTDLNAAIATGFPALESFVLAMNDTGRQHAYPEDVRFEITEGELSSYQRAADFLNVGGVDLVSVQHEFGIFGGEAGSHLLALLRQLRMPIVVTLHTALAEPDPAHRRVMDELTRLAERLVVMSADGATILREVHRVAPERIDVIPHGIPLLPSAKRSKQRLGLRDRAVILTFGFLAPDKGIEHVINALPAIREEHPEVLYIVLGATHPHVKQRHGEGYRHMLEQRVQALGLEACVAFHNEFVSHQRLTEFLAAADVYITPYLKAEQVTSGTLAYAVGSGKAVVSTPYSYARELLSDGRGILVPWPKDAPHAMAGAINALLGNDGRSAAIRRRAATYGQDMRWPKVARAYVESFERARRQHAARRQGESPASGRAEGPLALPTVNIDHLERLSDATGIVQHAQFGAPRFEDGYCLDDNARALILATRLKAGDTDRLVALPALAARYLAFVSNAFDGQSGRFRNFMSYSRQWLEEPGSEDCHGRALWALGTVISQADAPGRSNLAHTLFHAALSPVTSFTSPRAWAYSLIGIDAYLEVFQGDRQVQGLRDLLATRLLDLYLSVATPAWPWFEAKATYCNARLSQALLLSGQRLGREDMQATGLRSLEWLSAVQCANPGADSFAPIGSNGFYPRAGAKAAFDQQPVEACAMVSACLLAQRMTGDERWLGRAEHVFGWFMGQNQLRQPLYDVESGGCRDGLHAERLNENQGAESTISFLLALTELRAASPSVRLGQSGSIAAPVRSDGI